MTETSAATGETEARTEPRNVIVRRFATRTLHRVVDLSDVLVVLSALVFAVLRLTYAGPAWITEATVWQVTGYGAILFGANRLLDTVLDGIAGALDPERFDGDVFFAMTESLRKLQLDLNEGADPENVLSGLTASSVIEELGATTRTLSRQYAARGDEDEVQRLLAVVLHLRNADKNLGPDAVARSTAEAS